MRDRLFKGSIRGLLSTSIKRWQWWRYWVSIVGLLGTCSVVNAAVIYAKPHNTTPSIRIAQPQSAEEHYERGKKLYEQEKYRQALDAFNRAIALDAFTRAIVLDTFNCAFNCAIDFNPNSADTYFYRGLAYSNLEQYRKAILDYNQAIDLNPDYADAYYYKGLIFEDRGYIRKARINFERAAELYQQQKNGEKYRNAIEKIGLLLANRETLKECSRKPDVDVDTNTSTLVSIHVSPGGSVMSASVVASSGDSELDRLAIQFVRTCRFINSPNGREGRISITW